MDTHSSERKSIRHTGCQTDSTLFAQFICHSNETAMDLTSPLSISSLKWRFSPKASSKLLLSSGLCPNFYKLFCVCVCVFVWYLHLCQQVCLWIQIPWFAWTYPQHSSGLVRLQSPKLDVNRCCFIFKGRSASSREAADCLTSYRT